MAMEQQQALQYIELLLREQGRDEWLARLQPLSEKAAPRIQTTPRTSGRTLEERWRVLGEQAEARRELLDPSTLERAERYRHNIENFIGTVKVPIGLAGPLRVQGLFARGDYYVPLATTEAALVASYSRGSQLISAAGGATTILLHEGVSRAPGFAFQDLRECGEFLVWVTGQFDAFRSVAESTTRHGKLVDMRLTVEGNHVYLGFEYHTGDASGQNMVTLATQAILDDILRRSPIQPRYAFVESNLSGDKKASGQSYVLVRGKKVTAEVLLTAEQILHWLHTTPGRMVDNWRMATIGGVLSGTIGTQAHFANGLAALYLACGQDVACVAESAVGVTRLELTDDGGLYACVTLPNLMVGTVGGGTGLPSQKACLDVLGLSGPSHARALAEVAAALCLAGELSITGAIAAGDFSQAHGKLARGTRI